MYVGMTYTGNKKQTNPYGYTHASLARIIGVLKLKRYNVSYKGVYSREPCICDAEANI
jgi:hypothetical protein